MKYEPEVEADVELSHARVAIKLNCSMPSYLVAI